MKRRIAVFTGTRAEYGLLYWLMKEIQTSEQLELQLIVAAMHLSPEFGETWRQIERDGFHIGAKVEMLLSSDSAVGIAKSMGLGMIGFADALERLKPEILIVLGDRFEALAIVQTALVMRIPVAHLHGGEITEGAFDDAFRHAITKMSHLHFVAAEPYRRRVVQMGEAPETVFNVGALGLDHIRRTPRMHLSDIGSSINFNLCAPYFLVTYHPVTALDEDPILTTQAILDTIDRFGLYQAVFTYPNADNGGRAIIPLLENYCRAHSDRAIVIPSLGFERYHSMVASAAAVIGNSSSGIIEVPAHGIPSVNIGYRQQGRLAADSVIHCAPDRQAITDAITKAVSFEFSSRCRIIHNPYGQGDAAKSIVDIINTTPKSFIKHFHDLKNLYETRHQG
jgi:UDP-N-acetylglucosamine 2-epimerase (non-hydrolysing)